MQPMKFQRTALERPRSYKAQAEEASPARFVDHHSGGDRGVVRIGFADRADVVEIITRAKRTVAPEIIAVDPNDPALLVGREVDADLIERMAKFAPCVVCVG